MLGNTNSGIRSLAFRIRNAPLPLAMAATAASVLITPTIAQAQTAEAAPPQAVEQSQLDDVIVTARRRTETLRDAPISISVLSGENAEQRGLARIKDLAAAVPNFTISDAGSTNSSTTIVLRGISSNARNAGFEAGVGVYVDGVFTGRPASFNQDLVDIERIEVLRGPQGTLFGKNTIAGAVNITTVKPDYEFGGTAAVEFGNYGLFTGRGAVNIPLAEDTLAVRISGFAKSRDGYVLNLLDGARFNDEGAVGGRVQLRWDPADYARINVSFDVLDEERTQSFPETIDDPAAPGPRTTINDFDPFETRQLWGGSVTGDFDLSNGDVFSFITGYRSADIRAANDNDNTVADLLAVDFLDSQTQFSQELRLVSAPGRTFAYALGLYIYDQQAEAVHSGIFGTDFPLTGGTRVSIDGVASVATRSYAAYGDFQYDVTPAFSLLGGLRLTYEEKRLQYRQDGGLLPGVIFEPIPTLTDEISDDDLSLTAGLRYKFSPRLTGYARYATGYKSGGWNADFIGSSLIAAAATSGDGVFDARDIDFEPESVANYEIGLKGDWFARRLGVNLAVFSMDYQDLQVSQFLGVLNGGTVITNAGRAQINGVELEVTATPVSALQLNFALGYLDATFEEYDDCTATTPTCAGNRLPDAPEWSGSAGAEYTFDGWSFADITGRVEAIYRDAVFATPTNISRLATESYTLVNASLNFEPRGQNWSVSVWGRNLTDEDYLVGVADDDLLGTGRTFGGYGAPRTYGARLQYRY